MISPGYPGEMPYFTRGLASMGAQVIGLSDQPKESMPQEVREALTAHLQVRDLWNEGAVVEQVRREVGHVRIDRVECLWEPGIILAARLREALGTPGLNVHQTLPFRDKERMKQVLDDAGIRTPRHARALTAEEVWKAAGKIGFPLIVKPIAGAGSVDTHRIDSPQELEAVMPSLRHVDEVSVEEFVDGDEFTFDTICANGRILYENIAFYKPRPIEEKKHQWVSPTSICVRDIDASDFAEGREMGHRVIEALGFETGFSHMEWYKSPDGEIVFGEIGARPPGAHMVEAMNYASDIDLFAGWAEAVCHGRFSQNVERRYNSAIICKRAQGEGRIKHIEGLDRLRNDFGSLLVVTNILPLGSPRRDWQQTAVSDGFVILRHPELQTTIKMARRVAQELQIYAG